ncbi:MAG TPA: tetraacyldisaccharide 4'-kinase [Tepidisphaeraceae bacterium]|jgi:tetraacyldisaccharide 4'-kinase
MDGSERSTGALVLRSAARVVEPFYSGAMSVRNRLYASRVLKTHRLGRPVISIGNITTGGTGKTPVVRWLAERLRDEGRQVGILSRGYGSKPGELGDELTMLDRALNDGSRPVVFLEANPDRIAGAASLIAHHPEVQVLLLDDAFQHRRAARDMDIVLISAVNPFGFGHVLPRGLLREPLSGLSRAGAIIITHADQQSAEDISQIEGQIRRFNSAAPIYRAVHALVGLSSEFERVPMEALSGRRYFVFCGIGNPQALEKPLAAFGDSAGRRWYGDHHDYSAAEIASLNAEGRAAGADLMVTTEKDWAKIAALPPQDGLLPIWRVEMELRFIDGDGDGLLTQVRGVL